MPEASAEQHRAHNDLIRSTTSPANAVKILRALFQTDAAEIVPQVRCPTLVLHARKDAIIPFDEGRRMAAMIPGARFVPLETRSHTLLNTDPAWPQFVEAIEDFLPAAQAKPQGTFLNELSAREHEVLELVAQGLDNMTIGKRLGIAERTARNHVSTILSKLGVKSRAQAIVRARDAGFGRAGPA